MQDEMRSKENMISPEIDIEYGWLREMEKLNRYNEWLFSHVKNYLGDSVWEAGAGIGTYSKYMISVKHLFLSDICDDYLATLKLKFGSLDNVTVEKIDLINGDYKRLQAYNIDTVVCINVLEHVGSDLKAMENIYSVLRHDGRFLFVGPNHPFLYGGLDRYANHFRRYKKGHLVCALEKVGFRIEKVSVVNFLAALNWFWQSRVLRRKIVPSGDLARCEKMVPLAKFVDSINPFPIGSNIVVIAKK